MSIIRTVCLMVWTTLSAGPTMAQVAGTFVPTGDMSAPRSPTATHLQNGTVLVTGGCPASAELYDPAMRRFTPTGAMTAARCGHSATLLADGRVLIAGGDESGRFSAEVYDPADGTFSATGDMMGAQIGHTATRLPNGQVLIAGGIASTCCDPAQVDNPELYDPITGTFRLTGAFAGSGNIYQTGGPAVSAAIALPNGKVLIAAEPTSELYDPLTGSFQLTGVMATLCWSVGEEKPGYIAGRTATLLTNGLVLLTGGEHEDCGRFANAELYDAATGMFTPTGSMARPRDNHSATLLRDGTVLITGGESSTCCFVGVVASAELFDPSTGTFSPTSSMFAPRAGHSSTALDDGTVLVAGGYSFVLGQVPCCVPTSSAELYVGPTASFVASPDGTMVPTATQIIDNAGAAWTINPDSEILRNGNRAAGGSGTKILWTNSSIYVYGTDGNWWRWIGSGWINVGPDVPGGGGGTHGGDVSADGTIVPTTATQIIDNASTVWTVGFNSEILRDGIQAAAGWGTKILWSGSRIYVYGTDGNWWIWTGSGWTNAGPSIPGAGGGTTGGDVSADGTTVPTTATQIIDNIGAVWTIGSNSEILRNGIQAVGGWGTKILWSQASIYVYGTDRNWWQWTGAGWVNAGPIQP